MTVPRSRRHDSKVKYVHNTFVISEHVTDLMDRVPRSCGKMFYDPARAGIINLSHECKMANTIRVVDEASYRRRKAILDDALVTIVRISVILESITECLDAKRRDRLQNQISGIFDELAAEENMINGVMESDYRRFTSFA